jgi:hypothetical protein
LGYSDQDQDGKRNGEETWAAPHRGPRFSERVVVVEVAETPEEALIGAMGGSTYKRIVLCAVATVAALSGLIPVAEAESLPSGGAADHAVSQRVSVKYKHQLPGNFLSVDCGLKHSQASRRCAWELYGSRPVQRACVRAGYATVSEQSGSPLRVVLRPITCRQARKFGAIFN